MDDYKKLNGWKMLAYSVFLGPFFLTLYFVDSRRFYPAARYFAWASLLLMGLCAYLLLTFAFSPYLIRILYGALFLVLFGLAFMYCWIIDSKEKIPKPGPRKNYSLSRAIAWMLFMLILFIGMNNVIQAINFWLVGEQIAVYFSAHSNIFGFWAPVGLIYGFLYGINNRNKYLGRDLYTFARSVFFIFLFIFIQSALVLSLVIYPLQRLAPISYQPLVPDFIFYVLLFFAITLSALFLMQRAPNHGFLKATVIFLVGIPLVALHIVVVSTYSVTIDLTVASILEDRHNLEAAKKIYSKAMPHIRRDHLLASLHHRQGVLHVLNRDYESANASFKRVMADYSERYGSYRKAKRYVDSYRKNRHVKTPGRTILSLKHRTFEQAASCFPNSLSVILNFYEEHPVSTRDLSYAIKEGFSEGTFIWKAESFLSKNGYSLVTTFWQDKDMLISLLEAGFPVLIFVPGHVYTLYGYDSRMEMFFTYDTAESNRWNDKPFWVFQRDWTRTGFLMSVVVKQDEEENFATLFPQLFRYSGTYRLWQKAHLSNYYARKGNYWNDYDRYGLSQSLGLDRLKLNDPYFLCDDFYPFTWDARLWTDEVQPVLSKPWATDWFTTEKYILYLIFNQKEDEARRLVQTYESHLSAEARTSFLRLLELKLAAALATGNREEVLTISNKLIGMSNNSQHRSFWGHYFKGRQLMASGDLKAAVRLLLPVLYDLRLHEDPRAKTFACVLEALDEIYLKNASLITPEEKSRIEVARIHLAAVR